MTEQELVELDKWQKEHGDETDEDKTVEELRKERAEYLKKKKENETRD